jgi:cytochrome c oxidase subunit 4
MSSSTHDDHGHADDGAVHAHISSVPFYVGIFLTLLCLTVATVGQSYVDLGKANLFVVVVIATLKASLVVAFFMHLRYDNKFNALIFVTGLLFIGVFFAYTLNDTGRRGEIEEASSVHVLPGSGEQAPGGFDEKAAAEARAKSAAAHGGHAAESAPSGAPAMSATGHH